MHLTDAISPSSLSTPCISSRGPNYLDTIPRQSPPYVLSDSLRLKKKILCLKAAARICFSVRTWFCKIRTFIFFSWNYFFFHFYYEKRRKFAVLEEFKHVGAQKMCKIPFDFWKYGSWNFSVIFGFACTWRQRPIEVKNKIKNKKPHAASVWKILASFETKYFLF